MRLTAGLKVVKFILSLLDHFYKKSGKLWIIQRNLNIMCIYFFITVSTHIVSVLAGMLLRVCLVLTRCKRNGLLLTKTAQLAELLTNTNM